MQDSLRITPDQLGRIGKLSLNYQRRMDKSADLPDKTKKQSRLMQKKDAEMKAILDKVQYRKYFNREQLIRKQDTITYKGTHQPFWNSCN